MKSLTFDGTIEALNYKYKMAVESWTLTEEYRADLMGHRIHIKCPKCGHSDKRFISLQDAIKQPAKKWYPGQMYLGMPFVDERWLKETVLGHTCRQVIQQAPTT